MGKTKYHTSEDIWKQFHKMSKDKKIEILYDALDYMQQYNGRTQFDCISLAMGYTNTEGEDCTYMKKSER